MASSACGSLVETAAGLAAGAGLTAFAASAAFAGAAAFVVGLSPASFSAPGFLAVAVLDELLGVVPGAAGVGQEHGHERAGGDRPGQERAQRSNAQSEPDRNRLAIYHPEGNIKRSYHLDGRRGGPKFDETQVW